MAIGDNVIQVVAKLRDELTPRIAKLNTNIAGMAASFASSRIGIVAAGTALAALAFEATRTLSSFVEMSARTGESVETLSKLKYVADQSETSLEALVGGSRKLRLALASAASGSKEAQEAFAAINLSADELKSLSYPEQLQRIAAQFKYLKDDTERTAVAISLFGRAGESLVPILRDGGKELHRLSEEADKLGITIGSTSAEAFDRLADAMGRLKAQASAGLQNFFGGMAISLVGFTSEVDKARYAVEKLQAQLEAAQRQRTAGGTVADSDYVAHLKKELEEAQRVFEKLDFEEKKRQARLNRPSRVNANSKDLADLRAAQEALKKAAEDAAAAADKARLERQDQMIYDAKKKYEAETRNQYDFGDLVERVDATVTDPALTRVTNVVEENAAALDKYADDNIAKLNEVLGVNEQVTTEATEQWKQAARNIQDALADFLFDPLNDGLRGFLRNVVNILRRVLAEIAAAKIGDAIRKSLAGSGGSGGGGGALGFIGGLFGKLFGSASGGQIPAGPRVVGEEGMEIIASKGTAQVLNQRQLAFAAGGGAVRREAVNLNYAPQYSISGVETAAVVQYIERTRKADQQGMLRMLKRNGFGDMR